MLDPIRQRSAALGKTTELTGRFRQLTSDLVTEVELDFFNFSACLGDRGLQPHQLCRRLVTLATEAVHISLEAQQLHFGYRPRAGQRFGHGQFARRQFVGAGSLVTADLNLLEFLIALAKLLPRDGKLRLQALQTRVIEPALLLDNLGHFLEGFGRRHEWPSHGHRLEALGTHQQREILGLILTQRRYKTGGIDTQQYVSCVHNLTFAHPDFLDHASVDGLDDLQLARRNDLALALGDLIDLRKAGPDDEHQNHQRAQTQHRPCSDRCLFEPRPVGIGRPITAVGVRCRQPLAQDPVHRRPTGPTPGICAAAGSREEGFQELAHTALPIRPCRKASTTCCLGPSATILPPSTTMMRFTSSSSDVRWVTTIMVLPMAKLAS